MENGKANTVLCTLPAGQYKNLLDKMFKLNISAKVFVFLASLRTFISDFENGAFLSPHKNSRNQLFSRM
jgi:hypothetical protein